jgi:uncharacterized membrane protein
VSPITNATKAGIIAAVSPVVALAVEIAVIFGAEVTAEQTATITVAATGFVNAMLGLWVALTYKNSPKRLPDFPDEIEEP